MNSETKKLVEQIDSLIRQQPWFDFHVFHYDGSKLIIAGSTDLDYYHKLEVVFEDVFFVSGHFNLWHSNTKAPVFVLPENEAQLIRMFKIEQGYQLFVFKTEEYSNDFVVAAKTVSFNTDTVYYYNRTDLKENERIALFVKSDF